MALHITRHMHFVASLLDLRDIRLSANVAYAWNVIRNREQKV
ncbi:MAG: hypothetical protein WBD09_00330 [Halobacteriota archaeon]